MCPVFLVLHPQVLFPADSNCELHEMQRRTFMRIGDRLASLRAWFLSSISLTTDGGNFLTEFDALGLGAMISALPGRGILVEIGGRLFFKLGLRGRLFMNKPLKLLLKYM